MILPRYISSPVAKRLFLPLYGVPIGLEKNSGTSKKSWIFVNFDQYPEKIIWNLKKMAGLKSFTFFPSWKNATLAKIC